MTVYDLPTVNAVLNGLAATLLFVGWRLVREGRYRAHRLAMLSAVTCSALFLVSYLVYHAQVGSVPFTGQGPLRTLYFALLASHTVLAMVIVPLVLLTLSRALRGRLAAHRSAARLTLPLWTWVSLSGVAVYWMLYRL